MKFETLALLVLILSFTLASPSGRAASSNQKLRMLAPQYDEIVERIKKKGELRIIVSTKRESHDKQNARSLMQSERGRVHGLLKKKNILPTSNSRFGSRSIFHVNQNQLDGILDTPGVVQVSEDKLMRPSATTPGNGITNTSIAHDAGLKGADVAVAILDTGIDTDHVAFGSRIVAEACFSTKYGPYNGTHLCSGLNANGPDGQRTDTGSGSAENCDTAVASCDHGTHVASIVASSGATSVGVAPEADIIMVQVFTLFTDYEPVCGTPTGSCIAAFTSDVLDGLDHILSLAGSYPIASVNLSLGASDSVEHSAYCPTSSYAATINSLYDLGIVTVVAAGNNSFQNGVSSPACVEKAISVGAVDDDDVVATWSNSDDAMLDMLAPGVSISAAVPGLYAWAAKSGTSMAAPHVAGAVAVLKSKNPSLTPSQITDLLVDYTWTTSTMVLNNRAGDDPQPRLDFAPLMLPTISISSPTDGGSATTIDSIVLTATASDTQDGDITGSITWSSNLDGAITSPSTLSAGAHTLTATATDSDGMIENDAVTLTITEANTAPTVAISAPINNADYIDSDVIAFTAVATDPEDGDLSASIQWASNIDGALGTGAFINSALSAGSHTISATVTDSGSLVDVDNLTVNSYGDSDIDGMNDLWEINNFGDLSASATDDFDGDEFNNLDEYTNGTDPTDAAPSVTIVSPANGHASAESTELAFTGSASDAEDGDLSPVISWTSDLDGSLGAGAVVITSLSTGNHNISASVTDSLGASPFAPPSISVQVLPRDGDINGDGTVDIIDLLLMQHEVAGEQVLDSAAVIRADLYPVSGTGDGTINLSDLLLLQQLLVLP